MMGRQIGDQSLLFSRSVQEVELRAASMPDAA